MRNCLSDIPGLRIGHAHDAELRSGVSVVLFESPAIAAVSLLGGAPAVRDTALLSLENAVDRVDAIVLSGGSVYGLDATSGVQAAWRENGWSLPARPRLVNVPIVVQAGLFDLTNGGDKQWGRANPYNELGYRAARDAQHAEPSLIGSVGAGFGATTATLRGGTGTASFLTEFGHRVAVMVAVNAVGSTMLADTRHFWAAPFERDGEFGGAGWPNPLPPDAAALHVKKPDAWGTAGVPRELQSGPSEGTVIGIVATDADLTPTQAQRLAIAAQDGVARAVLPTHLARDGDAMFAASTGTVPLGPQRDAFTALCLAATTTTARAIARGVFAASPSPGPGCPPSWSERFGTHGAGR